MDKFGQKLKFSLESWVGGNLAGREKLFNFFPKLKKRTNFENKHIMAHYGDLMYKKIDIIKIIIQKKSDEREWKEKNAVIIFEQTYSKNSDFGLKWPNMEKWPKSAPWSPKIEIFELFHF